MSAWPSAFPACMRRGSEEVTQRSLSRTSIKSTASVASMYFDAQETLPEKPSDIETGALTFLNSCLH